MAQIKPVLAVGFCTFLTLSGCGGSSNDEPADMPDPQEMTNQDPDADPDNQSTNDESVGDELTPDLPPEAVPNEPGSGDEASSNNPVFAGLILLTELPPELAGSRIVTSTAGFYRVSDLQQLSPNALDFFDLADSLPAADECEIQGIGTFPPTISAGEVINLTGPSGTLAELTRQPNNPGPFDYALTGMTLDPANAIDLTFDIPGDEFPAFSNISAPNSISINGVSPPLDSTVSANTVFNWTPGLPGVTHMSISMRFDTNIAGSVFVSCFIEDDGEFEIPQNLRNSIGDASASGWNLDRRHFVNMEQGNAIIQVQRYTVP